MKMILKLWQENSHEPVSKHYSDKTRRFSSSVVPNSIKKAYVKVNYSADSYNDGTYETKIDLLKAIRDFLEEDKNGQ